MRTMPSGEALLDAARAARERAHAPYSGFAVGAAVETQDGSIVTGCNVENASFGLSICAERVAVVRAVAEGHRVIRAIAIAGPPGIDAGPCGACRQFLAEFDPDMAVSFTMRDGIVNTTLSELLPYAFTANAFG
ncbi:MAG TPA: cytidine deaminase [Candidatus Tyrphobacter sp.]